LLGFGSASTTTARRSSSVPEDVESHPVVILAGGLGTRMEGVASGIPKALVPVRGEPFAFHQLRLLASEGISEVVYVVGHRGEQVRATVSDGSAFGLAVTYVDEGEELHGTGGALRVALDRGALAEVFFVLYGDSYLPTALAPVFEAFAAADRPALMTVHRNEDRWDRSNAVLENGLVTVYDKGAAARDLRMQWIDYGLSVLKREIVADIPADAVVDLADVYRDLSSRGELAGYEVSERFYEVGSPEGLAELEGHLTGR
jgi:NDP-sugar pyrophosphorylase family protein